MLLSIMKEQDQVAMYLGIDKWTNSDTVTEKENESAKKWLKLSLERSKPVGCQWHYVMAAQQQALSVKYTCPKNYYMLILAVFRPQHNNHSANNSPQCNTEVFTSVIALWLAWYLFNLGD